MRRHLRKPSGKPVAQGDITRRRQPNRLPSGILGTVTEEPGRGCCHSIGRWTWTAAPLSARFSPALVGEGGTSDLAVIRHLSAIAIRSIRDYYLYGGGSAALSQSLPSLRAAYPDHCIEFEETAAGEGSVTLHSCWTINQWLNASGNREGGLYLSIGPPRPPGSLSSIRRHHTV